jgi:hypothetical protein
MTTPRLRHLGFLIAVGVAATTWLAAPTVSFASVIFDFTFQGDSSGAPGTVTGEIVLPDNANNNTTAATSVIIDSATVPFSYPLPYDTIVSSDLNTFTVTNGTITKYTYNAQQIISGNQLIYGFEIDSSVGDSLQVGFVDNQPQSPPGFIGNSNPALLTFTPGAFTSLAAPEPSALALLGTALAGLCFVRFRVRQR